MRMRRRNRRTPEQSCFGAPRAGIESATPAFGALPVHNLSLIQSLTQLSIHKTKTNQGESRASSEPRLSFRCRTRGLRGPAIPAIAPAQQVRKIMWPI
ncbi:hypothetical protein C7S13_0897 [Burkholderia cepacia]|nr:hypothetical protein [Burkholderia cepacia]